MNKFYVISGASVVNGKLQCKQILTSETYPEAVCKAQDLIAGDFGYSSWAEYLSNRDPGVTEEGDNYAISDDGGQHKECYRVEPAKVNEEEIK